MTIYTINYNSHRNLQSQSGHHQIEDDDHFPSTAFEGIPILIANGDQLPLKLCVADYDGTEIGLQIGDQRVAVPISELLHAIALSGQRQLIEGEHSLHLMREGHDLQLAAKEELAAIERERLQAQQDEELAVSIRHMFAPADDDDDDAGDVGDADNTDKL